MAFTGTVGTAVAATPEEATKSKPVASPRHYPWGEEFFPPESGDIIENGQVGVWWTLDTDDVLQEDLYLFQREWRTVILSTREWSEPEGWVYLDSIAPDTMYRVDDPRVGVGAKIYSDIGTDFFDVHGYEVDHWSTPYQLGVGSSDGNFFVTVTADQPTKIGLKDVVYKVGYLHTTVNIKGLDEDGFDALRDTYTQPDRLTITTTSPNNPGSSWPLWLDCYQDPQGEMYCGSDSALKVGEEFQFSHPDLAEFAAPEGYYIEDITYVDPVENCNGVAGETVGFCGSLAHKEDRQLELTVTYGKVQEATPKSPTRVPAKGCGQQATALIPEVEGVKYVQEIDGDTLTITAQATNGFVLSQDAETTWTFDIAAKPCPLVKFRLTFDPNGGVGGPDALEVSEGESIIIPEAQPRKDGYVFLGWLPVGLLRGSELVQPGDEHIAGGSTNFVAQWEEDLVQPPTGPVEPPTEPTEPPTVPEQGNASSTVSGELAQTGSTALPGVMAAALLATAGVGLLIVRKRHLSDQ